jgi:hypothetical protein
MDPKKSTLQYHKHYNQGLVDDLKCLNRWMPKIILSSQTPEFEPILNQQVEA